MGNMTFEKLTAVRLTGRLQWDELHAAHALWPWLADLTVQVAIQCRIEVSLGSGSSSQVSI